MTTMADPNSLAGVAQQTLQQQQQPMSRLQGANLSNVKDALTHYQITPGVSPFPSADRMTETGVLAFDRMAEAPVTNATAAAALTHYPSDLTAWAAPRPPPPYLHPQLLNPVRPAKEQYKPPEQPFQQPPPLPGLDFRAQAEQLQRGQTGPQSFNQQQPPTLPPQIGQQKFGNSGIGSLGGGGQTNVSLNLQGSATMNPQGANQNRGYPGWDLGNAGASGAGASGQMSLAEGGLASLGRGEDSMLVHMTPGEVHGLQAIALAHGGSLTINPHTGLPEAGFLRNILPAIAAAAAVAFLGPAAGAAAGATGALGMGAAGTGAAAGALTGALTNKENRLQGALMGGLGGYGIGGGMGAGMQSGLFGGTEGAGAGTLNTAAGITPPPTGSLSGIGLQSPTAVGTPPIGDFSLAGGSQGVAGATSVGLQGPASSAALGAGTGTGAPSSLGFTPASNAATMLGSKSTPTFMQALGEQFPTGMSKGAAGLGALGMVGAFDQPGLPEMPQEPRSTARLSGPVRRPYDPERNLFTDYGTLQPTYAAKGGEMRSVPQLEDGGFVLTKKAVDGMGGQREAAAGLGAIPIRGPGTGTSDSIPTTIDGVRPAKVSNGEAYVPRKRVKQAGGAKRLYALMRRAEQDAKRRSA